MTELLTDLVHFGVEETKTGGTIPELEDPIDLLVVLYKEEEKKEEEGGGERGGVDGV